MILVYYLIMINVLAFLLYGADKKRAERGKWRTPEAALIFVAVIGGSVGAFLGMHVFHHKTKKKKFYVTIPVLMALLFCAVCFCLYQNYHIVVTTYEYEADFDMKIVQISDLHNQMFGFGQKKLLGKIDDIAPDIIVVTGDVLDSNHTSYRLALDFFEGAVKIAPVYYVTGNHEMWLKRDHREKYESFLAEAERKGVVFLDKKTVSLENVVLAGAGDDSHTVPYDWEASKLKILLSHDPAQYEAYIESGADIVFTGHVHGGQIILPGKGGVFSPDFTFFPEIYEGEHHYGSMVMYVSRGLGNSVLPVRINNYPEIVVLSIHK